MKLYAMVDCNNFYASCERLFRPDLAGVAIVVLSNNDGCVIARSNEAKVLGVRMGAPTHTIKELLDTGRIVVFSSNYALYGDLSGRVMETLRSMGVAVEVYSIDEAFLDISNFGPKENLTNFGSVVKDRVAQWNGMPVCVGIAQTKTLAKLANNRAKKHGVNGVLDLTSPDDQRTVLEQTPVSEVWGIGKRMTANLSGHGITTAWDLCKAPVGQMRGHYSVVLERTIRELGGQACIPMELEPPVKQEIGCSRSFGSRLLRKADIATALANHAERAGRKLRRENRLASEISIFVKTNIYAKGDDQNEITNATQFDAPTNDTAQILNSAVKLLDQAWCPGFMYHKAGIMLRDLSDPDQVQGNLLATNQSPARSRLMELLDGHNSPGKVNINFASSLASPGQRDWHMNRNYLSPAYTTSWKELPKVR